MRPFLSDFYERRKEVRRYVAIISNAEKLVSSNRTLEKKHERELRMLRAGAMLVLYNAIEASARSAIVAIYDEIGENGASFDQLRGTIKKRVIKDFKTNFGIDRADEITDVARHLAVKSFDSAKLFSGNVDAKEIKHQGKLYGFACDTAYERTRHGEDLVNIKNKRNDLAHGNASFSEVGREYTAADIKRVYRLSLNFVEEILISIDRYLDRKEYLDQVPQ